jgi:hypothetical protein
MFFTVATVLRTPGIPNITYKYHTEDDGTSDARLVFLQSVSMRLRDERQKSPNLF